MGTHYYSTQSFLAWCLNHYFYSGCHFTFVGAPFHPHGLRNPSSSNPYVVYDYYYRPWQERDLYSDFVAQKRRRVSKGVIANKIGLSVRRVRQLLAVCRYIDIVFFYPIVYRIDVERLPDDRKEMAGSGPYGSREYLVKDLREDEFEVLFFDPASDPGAIDDTDVESVGSPLLGRRALLPSDVMDILWGRCNWVAP